MQKLIDPANAALGARIRQARETKGIKPAELGRRLGVTRSSVSQWESGLTVPASENLVQIASILGVTLDWLDAGGKRVLRLIQMAPGPEIELVDWKKLSPEQTKVLTAIAAGRKQTQTQIWVVLQADMMATQYHVGQHLLVDTAAKPRTMDFVLVEDHGVPLIRLFSPPYLYAMPNAPQPTPTVVDNKNVIVKGVWVRWDQ